MKGCQGRLDVLPPPTSKDLAFFPTFREEAGKGILKKPPRKWEKLSRLRSCAWCLNQRAHSGETAGIGDPTACGDNLRALGGWGGWGG